MRTVLYHKEFPLGKVFDTETNKEDPYMGTAPFGSVDSPGKIAMTQDELIERVVRDEFKNHGADRRELEGEFKKKTGATEEPHFAAKNETLVKALDDHTIRLKKKVL